MFHVGPIICPRLPHEDVGSKKRGLYGKERSSKHHCVLNPYLVAYLQLLGEFRSWDLVLILMLVYIIHVSHIVHMYLDMLFTHWPCARVCTEDTLIQDFLWIDSCAKLADKVKQTRLHGGGNSISVCSISWLWCMCTSEEQASLWSRTIRITSLLLCKIKLDRNVSRVIFVC